MNSPLMQWVESQQLRSDLPNPPIGAQVKVNYRIREGEKERVQAFAGVVIKKHKGQKSLGATFTVRKVTQGFGVERVFPLHSPRIESIEVLRQGKVRRAKLYYLRSLSGKKARLVEQRQAQVG
jgi:large subunit ribosomal protein L19